MKFYQHAKIKVGFHEREDAMKKILSMIVLIGFALVPFSLYAKDVYVKGYYRKDGTYVRPHIRSSPDGIKSNNYGPSQTSDELMNPRSRDYDKDGTPNYLDLDSDNDGIHDDADSNPFGKSLSSFSIKSYNQSLSILNKEEKKSSTSYDYDEINIPQYREIQEPSNAFIVYFRDGKKLICDKAWEDGDKIFLVMHERQFAIGYDRNKIDMKRTFNISE